MVAGAIERKLWCSNGYVTTYPNMYVFIIGDRGVGKSVMTNIAMRILEEVPGIEMAANKINDASLIKKLTKVGQKRTFEYQGVVYKNSSVFLYASEATSTFKEMYPGASIISTLTDLYNCNDEPWTLNAKWKKDTMKDDEVAVHNPCINMLACSTPQWLMSKVMRKDDIEGGFGSRVVMVVHEGNFEFQGGWQAGSLKEAELRAKVVEDLRIIANLKGPMQVSVEWRAAHKAYSKQHYKALAELEHRDSLLAACLARKASTSLMKLSMVLSVAEGDSLVLTAEHAHKAWEMLSTLEKHIPYAFKNIETNYEVAHTRDLWSWLRDAKKKTFSRKEAIIMLANRWSSAKIRDAIYELTLQGKIEPNMELSSEKNYAYDVISEEEQSRRRLSQSQTESNNPRSLA